MIKLINLISEAKEQVYFNTFSAAVQYAETQVEKRGYKVDEDDWWRKVATGPKKPSVGKTNRYVIELTKDGKPNHSTLAMQIYGLESGKYELNFYMNISKKKIKEMIKLTSILNESFNAGEVLKQLGGNKFIAMTGAKNFVQDQKTKMFAFKIGGGAKKSINYIRIKLTSMDLYDMEFIRLRGGKITVVAKETGVYNDQLQTFFTKHTGMYIHL